MKKILFSILLSTIFLIGCKKNNTSVSGPVPTVTPDIYIVGNEYDAPTNHLYAKYWKNGVGTNLTDGTYAASATAIVSRPEIG